MSGERQKKIEMGQRKMSLGSHQLWPTIAQTFLPTIAFLSNHRWMWHILHIYDRPISTAINFRRANINKENWWLLWRVSPFLAHPPTVIQAFFVDLAFFFSTHPLWWFPLQPLLIPLQLYWSDFVSMPTILCSVESIYQNHSDKPRKLCLRTHHIFVDDIFLSSESIYFEWNGVSFSLTL